MSIRIDQKKCVGCGKCMEVCPGSLLKRREGKACICYPRDCWGCASCVKECPVGAIEFYLGEDIGGKGSTLKVNQEENILHWIITKPDGRQVIIDVDRKESNRY